MQQNISLDKLLMTLTYILNISEYSDITGAKWQSGANNLTQSVCHIPQIQELSKIVEAEMQRSSRQLDRLAAINAQLEALTTRLSGGHVCESQPDGEATIFLNIGDSKLRPTQVLCRSNKYGNGWMLIAHRRIASHVFATVPAEQWKQGFGDVSGEFFIGVEKLHALTAQQLQQLLIVTVQQDGVEHFDRFATFALDDNYKVSLLGAHTSDRSKTGAAANDPTAIRLNIKAISAYLNPKANTHLQLDIYLRPTTLEKATKNEK